MEDDENTQIEQQILALIENLEVSNKQEAVKLVKRLSGRLENTNYWYSTRLERLSQWARQELGEKQREQFFGIIANGSASADEPPTYAQQYNRMKWRMEKAEAELIAIQFAKV